ncbi:MAG: beta-N-acetylhexosaminidase [Sutterellaceae bacterium]|nr:beta-N-acetylhexosaminidase [Sutterellaceae bacterium]MDD7441291.1 beta-N-acetylhexosaminidase [Sutterellaceae bacterium]MDY2868862.1 beta-N-acetylhexosaminidase [Mesosutterella sp.]
MLGPIVTDVSGTVLTEEDRKRIRSPLVGMVILFTRNYESPEQLASLCSEIHAEKPGVLISVDHEGGRVQRFREGFTRLPALAQYGRMRKRSPGEALRAAWSHGYVLASELLSLGVDFSFAPDLDLDWGHSRVIGHRSFSKSPEAVAELALAMASGMHAAGMACCGKHFPGHGWANADSHRELPEDTRFADEIIDQDVKPYSWLGQALDSVMTAHVAYPGVDELPATFSSRWIQDVLREQCGFEGLVFSDDLAMGGALGLGGVVERAEAALLAGCDALIICNSPEQSDELLAGLRWERTEEFDRRSGRLDPAPRFRDRGSLSRDPVYQDAVRRVPRTDPDLVDWTE